MRVRIPRRLYRQGALPPICVRTGTDAIGHSPLPVFAGWFKKIRYVHLPLCEAERERARRRGTWLGLALLGTIVALCIGAGVGEKSDIPFVATLCPGLIVDIAIFILIGRFLNRGGARVLKATDDAAELEIPSEAAARAIEAVVAGALPVALAEGTRCPAHHEPATYICARCGDFLCATCFARSASESAILCPPCDERAVAAEREKVRVDLIQRRRSLIVTAIGALIPGNVPFQLLAYFSARGLTRDATEHGVSIGLRTARWTRVACLVGGLGSAILFACLLFLR